MSTRRTAEGDDDHLRWRVLLEEATERLASVAGDGARREAGWLVADIVGCSAAELTRRLDDVPTVRAVARFDEWVARRARGEPLQYVLGHWPFRHLDLAVDQRALIPRPETEAVVDVALFELDRLRGRDRATAVVDLGAGSGAIGLSVAVERPRARVWLCDVDPDAAELARANAAGTGRVGARVTVCTGDWFDALAPELAGCVDLVVSNPPYVAADAVLDPQVSDWEPEGALRSGVDGLDDLRRIIAGASRWLADPGALVLEHGFDQQPAVLELMVEHGFEPTAGSDLAGLPRWVAGRRVGHRPAPSSA